MRWPSLSSWTRRESPRPVRGRRSRGRSTCRWTAWRRRRGGGADRRRLEGGEVEAVLPGERERPGARWRSGGRCGDGGADGVVGLGDGLALDVERDGAEGRDEEHRAESAEPCAWGRHARGDSSARRGGQKPGVQGLWAEISARGAPRRVTGPGRRSAGARGAPGGAGREAGAIRALRLLRCLHRGRGGYLFDPRASAGQSMRSDRLLWRG
jgi:hypothetical protein